MDCVKQESNWVRGWRGCKLKASWPSGSLDGRDNSGKNTPLLAGLLISVAEPVHSDFVDLPPFSEIHHFQVVYPKATTPWNSASKN
jgi:hypothetical protein